MPSLEKEATIPDTVRQYTFYGVNVDYKEGKVEAIGECPFCGKENKFSIHVERGVWKCWSCGEGTDKGGGNLSTFVTRLMALSVNSTPKTAYAELAANRKLLFPSTLEEWGVVKSYLTDDWLIPGYDPKGRLRVLYKYVRMGNGKYRLLLPPSGKHCIFGTDRYSPDKPNVYLFEGPWDAMAAYEVMRGLKEDPTGGYLSTGNPEASLLKDTNILAAPGANVFSEDWVSLFTRKNVTMFYDNDYPKVNAKAKMEAPPVGYAGMKRVSGILVNSSEPPDRITYLLWGENGYDREIPDGTDVRDVLSMESDIEGRGNQLAGLLGLTRGIPEDWAPGRSSSAKAKGSTELDLLPCSNWKALTTAWKKALKWTQGLDTALSVMLASIASTKTVGDQLWVKIIGPASCGKSTLCEAISVNRKYVKATSTLRGFHSGFKEKDTKEDNGLIPQVMDKTLVVKDGDTLLQSPNLGQILSEARDVYDRVSRSHYRNKMGKDHAGINMTFILCGTNSLRALDDSELGERFIDCVIVSKIDEDLEDEVGWRIANRAARDVTFEANGKIESSDGPELVNAKRLTAGYVSFLRDNALELLSKIEIDEDSLRLCQRLAKFVAYMRARPSKRQAEVAEREMSFRLISQHVRLATCLTIVLNKEKVDAEVMKRVRKVALDTARGISQSIVAAIYSKGNEGLDTRGVCFLTKEPDEKVRKFVNFLRSIGAIEEFPFKGHPGLGSSKRWRLTEKFRRLYESINPSEE